MEYVDFDRICGVISMSLANHCTNYIHGKGNTISCGEVVCVYLSKAYTDKEFQDVFVLIASKIREFRAVKDLPILVVRKEFSCSYRDSL